GADRRAGDRERARHGSPPPGEARTLAATRGGRAMESDPSPAAQSWARFRDLMLLALTWAAGYIDAIGYLALGGVFTANMTGNTVLLGLHVSQEQGAAALRALTALGGGGAGAPVRGPVVRRGAACRAGGGGPRRSTGPSPSRRRCSWSSR